MAPRIDTIPVLLSCLSPLILYLRFKKPISSVADPDPNPQDNYVFGPSGSISQRYGSESGSGSFYHHAKIVVKALIPTI